jgi:hypothetical protein
LFNPAEALRCDCGYDFASKMIESSYRRGSVVQRHGGEARTIEATSRTKITTRVFLAMATLQWVMGAALLALAGWLYLQDRTSPNSHSPGRILEILVAPPGIGLIVSGLALRFRWPGWQVLQLAPWLALALTMRWLQSL